MPPTETVTGDVVSGILGLDDNSKIARLRADRPSQIAELQAYYEAVFGPNERADAALPLADRLAIAIRVASRTRSSAVVSWYAERARSNGTNEATISRLSDVTSPWTGTAALDAAVRHADLVTTSPVSARPSDLQALKDAGFSPAGIVSLSQVIAFVSYQLRLIAGLRALGVES
jgi:CMD domain protein